LDAVLKGWKPRMQHGPKWTPRSDTSSPFRRGRDGLLASAGDRLRRRILAGALAALLAALASMATADGRTPTPGSSLALEALLQEGGLLRDELERLRLPEGRLAEEGVHLDAEEQSLRAASEALGAAIQNFNAAGLELEKSAQAHQGRCPKESEDAALVEACNAEAARIRAQLQQRAAQGPALKQRQLDLNADIAQHNSARQDWAGRKTNHDALAAQNRRDLTAWLQRAEDFFGTDGYRAAYQAAAGPAACKPAGLQDLAAAPTAGTLDRVLGCLRALKEGA
jgi:hypothetical protein